MRAVQGSFFRKRRKKGSREFAGYSELPLRVSEMLEEMKTLSDVQKQFVVKCILLGLEFEVEPDKAGNILIIKDGKVKTFVLHNGKLAKVELLGNTNTSAGKGKGIVLQAKNVKEFFDALTRITDISRDEDTVT